MLQDPNYPAERLLWLHHFRRWSPLAMPVPPPAPEDDDSEAAPADDETADEAGAETIRAMIVRRHGGA